MSTQEFTLSAIQNLSTALGWVGPFNTKKVHVVTDDYFVVVDSRDAVVTRNYHEDEAFMIALALTAFYQTLNLIPKADGT